ncbi:cytochrome P450 [Radiomyces spectabilis]|uniref:cytochrome P450 n=1 Tax=Radiomyces spectabilis TaxID=64574 RepID=UPI0022204999|nr:cytochrome P450 [Radiomyces spectabilis]KAI8391720.1 cytochrome P450 [Radiomyces spectabilis]
MLSLVTDHLLQTADPVVFGGILGTIGLLATLRALGKSQEKVHPSLSLPPYAPGCHPILGHLLQIMRPITAQELFRQWSLVVGPVFTVQFGQKRWIILNSMDAVKDLIVSRSTIYSSRDLPDALVNDIMGGVEHGGGFAFYPYGKEWRHLRRIAHSGLVKKKIDSYQPILSERRDVLLSNIWKAQMKQEPLRLTDIIEHFTMTTVLSIAFGDICSFEPGDEKLHEAFALTEQTAAIFGPVEQLREFFPVLKKILPSRQAEYARIRERGFEFYGGFLAQLKTLLEQEPGAVKDCFVKDILIKGELTDMQIINLITVFVGAGSETTASTIEWMIALLANHPEFQDRVYEEIEAYIGLDRLPDAEDEHKLPYLQCVIHETLRLRPPAPLSVPHATSEDDVYGNWFIPANTTVIMNLHAIQQDPVRYPEPQKFIPERHMEYVTMNNNKQRITQTAEDRPHLGFSTGRRVCVGIHLAERSLFMAAAGLLACFKFERVHQEPIQVDLPKDIRSPTFTPQPYEIRVVPRHAKVHHLFQA